MRQASANLAIAASCSVGVLALSLLWMRRRNSGRKREHTFQPAPRRFGGAIKLKPDKYQRYRELHDDVWEQVLERMYKSNIRNFVIYYHKETSTMFQSFEWVGHWQQARNKRPLSRAKENELFEADMRAIADDPVTRKWWKECEPCQEPFSQWKRGSTLLSNGGTGDWWANLECVNHCGHWPTAYSEQRRDPDFVRMSQSD